MALDTYALTTFANAKTYLGLSSTSSGTVAEIEGLINRASDIVEGYCNRKFVARLYAKERHDGREQQIIYFDNPPVVSVCLDELAWSTAGMVTRSDGGSFYNDGFSTENNKVLVQNSDNNSGLLTLTAVSTGGTTLTFSDNITADSEDNDVTISNVRSVWINDDEVDEDNFTVDEDHIYYYGEFPEGHRNIKITYYGGYSTIPDDLEQACLEIVQILYEGNENIGNIQSEKLGDHSITYANYSSLAHSMSNVSEATKYVLDKYKRIAI
jgi:hypothetical protein